MPGFDLAKPGSNRHPAHSGQTRPPRTGGRNELSQSASLSRGIAARYAAALFDLASEAKGLAALEKDIEALTEALAVSPALQGVLTSPVVARAEAGAALMALAKKLKLSKLTTHTLALMAQNRRLFALPALLAALEARLADERGEVTAEVTSAAALPAPQAKKLAQILANKAGKVVKLKTAVDESLIGGMIVKLGSTMIDTSIKSRLAALQNAMKEVG